MGTIKTIERNITHLLLDGIKLCIEAEIQKLSFNEFSESLSRATLLSAFSFLESVANVCLESLNLGKHLEKDIDRIPTLSKFDLYLSLKFKNRKLDRGYYPVQGAQELKVIRDAFVHPKRYEISWEEMVDGTLISESRRGGTLKLPKEATYFGSEDAVVSLRAAHIFMSYFFADICKFSPARVSKLLFSEDFVTPSEEMSVPYLDKDIKQWLVRRKIPIRYMRLA